MMLTNLADVLRSAKLPVTEIAGWHTRGHGQMSGVKGVMWHHTATPQSAPGDYPSLGIVQNGRAGLAGPLANLGLGRSGMWYVIAAGLAWHAGTGSVSWCGTDNGNNWIIGVEAEHPGLTTQPWPVAQLDSYRRGTAALLLAYGLGAERTIGHKEWAPTRKVDPISLSMNAERAFVSGYMHPAPPKKRNVDVIQIFEYQACPKDGAGNPIEQEHTFVCPVGDVSSLIERVWLSFKCANGPATRVKMMSVASGQADPYHGNGTNELTWANVQSDRERRTITAGGAGCKVDQFTAFVTCAQPYSLAMEVLPK